MISNRHKCIFIHISKCAGSSIESAFGIDISNISTSNNKNLFGWNDEHKLYLQHATPQQLLDHGFVSKKIWNTYYKFVIIRNPWERAVSDYIWMMNAIRKTDSFKNYLLKKGKFKDVLTDKFNDSYRGDHLNKQKDYFHYNGEDVIYDNIIRMEDINSGLTRVIEDLSLPKDFFNRKANRSKKNYSHYSHFYNAKRKKLFESVFSEDIEFLDYKYEEKKKGIKKYAPFLIRPKNS